MKNFMAQVMQDSKNAGQEDRISCLALLPFLFPDVLAFQILERPHRHIVGSADALALALPGQI